jgi:hypothetical protein
MKILKKGGGGGSREKGGGGNEIHQETCNWGGIFKRTDDHIFEKTLKIELSPIPQAYPPKRNWW